MLLVGTVLPRWQILLTALLCTFLADFFDPFPFTLYVALPQGILVFTSLAGAGLFSCEVARNRRREVNNFQRLEKEVTARREAKEELEFLIESSPAAILTMSPDYLILRANSEAHRLLGVSERALPGTDICRYLPALSHVPLAGRTSQTFRTEMQCHGERENGEVLRFLLDLQHHGGTSFGGAGRGCLRGSKRTRGAESGTILSLSLTMRSILLILKYAKSAAIITP